MLDMSKWVIEKDDVITSEIYCIDIYVKQKKLDWDYYWGVKMFNIDMY